MKIDLSKIDITKVLVSIATTLVGAGLVWLITVIYHLDKERVLITEHLATSKVLNKEYQERIRGLELQLAGTNFALQNLYETKKDIKVPTH